MNGNFIRRAHRYLGLLIGIQFIFWIVSGLYFSWTNLDEIHGDHFKVLDYESKYHTDLFSLNELASSSGIQTVELREITGVPHYWVNNKNLYNAETGELKDGISKDEALWIAQRNIKSSLEAKTVELITEVGNLHEYRGRLLPAFVISYDSKDEVKAYVSKIDGKFQTLRHRKWRWFDFLWMTHTMDYNGRDNFNTFLLRTFSLLGLLTVLSGFVLYAHSYIVSRRFK